MITPETTLFLVDVDNTLLDNDHIQADLKRHLEREFGAACRDRYWTILEDLFTELGYRDYLGALQRYRAERPREIHLLSMSSYLVDYPFANRLYPQALDVLERAYLPGSRRPLARPRSGCRPLSLARHLQPQHSRLRAQSGGAGDPSVE